MAISIISTRNARIHHFREDFFFFPLLPLDPDDPAPFVWVLADPADGRDPCVVGPMLVDFNMVYVSFVLPVAESVFFCPVCSITRSILPSDVFKVSEAARGRVNTRQS